MKTRFKLNKTWVILGIALLIGGLAAVGARSYLSTQIEVIEARGKGKTIKIIVASRELKRGDRISSETVSVRAIPVDYAHSAAVPPEAFERIDGQPLAYPVRSGEMIMWGLLESPKAATFSARVESGHRAMTVAVDEINSISGLLEPGDLIDLLVTVDQNGKKITRPLLQSVRVMATGQRAVDSPREGERRHYSTVTIDITPAQAQNVIMARDAGRVTALLRNPDDKNSVPGGNANMAALLNSTSAAVAPVDSGIPVLYGGNMKNPPDALAMGRRSTITDSAASDDDLLSTGTSVQTTQRSVPTTPVAPAPGIAIRSDR